MISRKFIIWACGLLFVFGSCAEDMVKPIENDKDAPGTVQNVKTESLPGAVKFTYTLPSDPDLNLLSISKVMPPKSETTDSDS